MNIEKYFTDSKCNCNQCEGLCVKHEENTREVKDDEIMWARTDETVKLPNKREEDAGMDIYAHFEEDYLVIAPHTTVTIPSGLRSAFSSKWVALLWERGSNGTKGLKQSAGCIDSGYRGEWMLPLTNCNDKGIVIAKKEYLEANPKAFCNSIVYPYEKAVCQVLFVEVPKFKMKEISVEELLEIPSQRGEGKLGSSNK